MLDCIAPGPDDIVLPKTSSSVFISTNLDYLLRCLGKRQARAHKLPALTPAERHVHQHLDLLTCCHACAPMHQRMSRSHAVEDFRSLGVSAALKTRYVAGGSCRRADRPVCGECGAGRVRPAVPGHPGHRCAERDVLGGFWGLASRPAICSTCPPWSQVRRARCAWGFLGFGVPPCDLQYLPTLVTGAPSAMCLGVFGAWRPALRSAVPAHPGHRCAEGSDRRGSGDLASRAARTSG